MTSLDRILKTSVYIGLVALLFTPFIVFSEMFFPFITGKNFFFRIVIELIFAFWLILAMRNEGCRPKKSGLLWAAGALVAVTLLSALFGANPDKSIWSNYERMEGWITIVHLFGYFLVLSSMLREWKHWKRFLNVSLGVAGVLGIYSILQLFGILEIHQGSARVDATFGNATYLAVYMLFHIFIASWFLVRSSQDRIKLEGVRSIFRDRVNWLYMAGAALFLVTLYFTATRGAILGLIGGAFIALLLIALFEKNNEKLKRLAIIKIIVVLILVGGFFVLKDTAIVENSSVLSRIANISLEEKTTKSRFLVWEMAWEGFKDRPVLGWGQENFNYVFNTYYYPEMYDQEQWFDRAHNAVFDWMINGGILGLGSYLALFFFSLFYIWKRMRILSVAEKSLLTGLFAAYFFHNLFVFDNVSSYLLFFTFLAFINKEAGTPFEKNKQRLERPHWSALRTALPGLILVASLAVVYVVNVKGILQSFALVDSLKSIAQNDLEGGLQNYRQALAYNSFGTQELRENIAQTAGNFAGRQMDLSVKQEYFTLARDEMQKMIEEDPQNARFEVFMGSLFDRYRFYEESIPHWSRALELSPQKQSIMFGLASNYIMQGKPEEALPVLKNAYELAPQFDTALNFYAAGLIYTNQIEQADVLLMERYDTVLVADDRLIRAYLDNGIHDRLIGVWEKTVKENPNNAQFHLSLAVAYLEAERRTEAIEEIEKVIELNPSFKDQGEYYINEIRAGRNP